MQKSEVREPILTPQAEFVYGLRYLRKEDGKVVETPGQLHHRVASTLCMAEDSTAVQEAAYHDFFRLINFGEALPNSPTLMNAGKANGMMSACFTFHVEDSLEHILDVVKYAGLVQRDGGGVGYGLSRLRPSGSIVRRTGNTASGPVGFMPMYQEVAKTITQGGARQGAQMAILSSEHPDVEQFIECKNKDPEKFSTFNISVAASDEFMDRAIKDRDSRESKLLDKMALSAWTTGDPGCYFIDAAERANPTPQLGRLESTNPCGEVPLLHGEACNLGSINLMTCVRVKANDSVRSAEKLHYEVDYDEIRRRARILTRLLDNVITLNTFPVDIITRAVAKTRKIGMGAMGYADLLALLGLHYDTAEALAVGDSIAQTIQSEGHAVSIELGASKTPYPAWLNSVDKQPRRNATVTCIAPTGSISILAGCSSGIEPHPFLSYKRRIGNKEKGDYSEHIIEEPIMDALKNAGSGFVPRTSHNIHWKWHIEHQATWQRSVDLAVSKTINMPNSVDVEEIRNAYIYAWQTGCKGITVYRSGSREGEVISAG